MKRLELYRPLKPWSVNQIFGVNKPLYEKFGLEGHDGIDLFAIDWQPIYSATDGVVLEVSSEKERGLGIDIRTIWPVNIGEHGDHIIKIRYWHLAGLNVKVGDNISVGQLIGWADNTGYSTGTHLHFEIKPIINDNGIWKNVYQNNGFFGAINPEPFIMPQYAFDLNNVVKKIQLQLAELFARLQDFLSRRGF